jgi:hypothetical protein
MYRLLGLACIWLAMQATPLFAVTPFFEIQADNRTSITDEYGESDPWLEISWAYHLPLTLAGHTLTDDPEQPDKYYLPDVTIEPWGHIIIWLDGQPEQGDNHATFAASPAGGGIWMFAVEGEAFQLFDHFDYGLMGPDQAFGDLGGIAVPPGVPVPNGYALGEYLASPTPGDDNSPPSSPVVINEFLLQENDGYSPFLELLNRSDQPVDIGGWGLSDDLADPFRFVLAEGTVLGGEQLLVFDLVGVGLSPDPAGGLFMLTEPTGLYGQDFVPYPQQEEGFSTGRYFYIHLWYLQPPSPGSHNITTAVGDEADIPRTVLKALGASPNPFNPATEIRFELSVASEVTVDVYDLTGRPVNTLQPGRFAPGIHGVRWNGRDQSGRSVPSGVYMARIAAGGVEENIKLVLAK